MTALDPVAEKARTRARISNIEGLIAREEQMEFKIINYFSKGVYAREMFLPKGSIVVGKIHKFENLNIISKGEVSFFSIDGAHQVTAPYTFVGSPGAKRVIFAHEDTVWTTIHGTDETDIDKIEEQFIAREYAEVDGIGEDELKLIEEAQKCLGL